jgi:hypothetical protein
VRITALISERACWRRLQRSSYARIAHPAGPTASSVIATCVAAVVVLGSRPERGSARGVRLAGLAHADFAGPDLAAALWSAALEDRVVAEAAAIANGGRC